MREKLEWPGPIGVCSCGGLSQRVEPSGVGGVVANHEVRFAERVCLQRYPPKPARAVRSEMRRRPLFHPCLRPEILLGEVWGTMMLLWAGYHPPAAALP